MDGFRDWLAGFARRSTVGARGERAAAKHLRRHGYRVLARNLRTKLGEIDLLALAPDRRTVVVVEVKSSRADDSGPDGPRNPPPEVHVNTVKQRKLVGLACLAARQHGLQDHPIRFDVIGVDLPAKGKPTIRHHENAFASHV